MAADDCVRGLAAEGSVRATRQRGHQQFHWGKPPPAALPSRRTCTPARGGAHREPRRRHSNYLVAAYAVTSIVTATTVNSGFVHSISLTPSKCIDSPSMCKGTVGIIACSEWCHYRGGRRSNATDTPLCGLGQGMKRRLPRPAKESASDFTRAGPAQADPRARNRTQRHRSPARLQGS